MKKNVLKLTLFMMILAASSESFCAAAAAPKHRKAKTVLVQPSPVQVLIATSTIKIFAKLLEISQHAENDEIFNTAYDQYFKIIDNDQIPAQADDITRARFTQNYQKLLGAVSEAARKTVLKRIDEQWDQIKDGALKDILKHRSTQRKQRIQKQKSTCSLQ
jgi:hypothetical protein